MKTNPGRNRLFSLRLNCVFAALVLGTMGRMGQAENPGEPPTSNPETVKEGNGPAAKAPGVTVVKPEEGYAVYSVGSGKYEFEAEFPMQPAGTANPGTGKSLYVLKWSETLPCVTHRSE